MLDQIRARLAALRKSERRVAAAVLSDPRQAVTASVAGLAARAGVSGPTVIRFCQALGCSGYREFRLRLAESLAQDGSRAPPLRYARLDLSAADPPQRLAEAVIDAAMADLMALRRQLDGDALSRAADWLRRARRAEFYGAGGNAVVASDAQLKFSRLGIAATGYADVHLHAVAASLLRPGDVAVAISNSGRNKDLLNSLALARRTGAKTVAVTAAGSPLARAADLALNVTLNEPDDAYGPIKARVALLLLIDILAVTVALGQGNATLTRLARLNEVLQTRFVDR